MMKRGFHFCLEFLKVTLVALGLWILFARGSAFLGFDTHACWFMTQAPALLFSDEDVWSCASDLDHQKNMGIGHRMSIGRFQLLLPKSGLGSESLSDQAFESRLGNPGRIASVAQFLEDKLQVRPGWIPLIELTDLSGMDGSYKGLRLTVNRESSDPFAVVAHEISHLYLFWSLFPGLPFDCPRWFNEGMAEEVSARAGRQTPDDFPDHLVAPYWIVSPEDLSPAFSWPGSFAEIQGRHAFRQFVQEFGWQGVRTLTRGLRAARPYRSIIQLQFQRSPETLARSWVAAFQKQHDQTTLSLEECRNRLARRATFQNEEMVLEELQVALERWPEDATLQGLRVQILVRKIQRALQAQRPLEALGRLSVLKPMVSESQFLELLGPIRLSLADVKRENETAVGKMPRRGGPLVWVASLLIAGLLLRLYRWGRERGNRSLLHWWNPPPQASLWFRWVVVALFAWGAAWFLRLLLIGLIPYAGVGGITEYARIALAESAVICCWVAFFLQLRRWNKPVQNEKKYQNQSSFTLPEAVLIFSAVGSVAIDGWFGHLVRSEMIWREWLTSSLLNVTSLLASGLLIWGSFGFWAKQYPQEKAWIPALVATLLRGGICFNMPGTPALFFFFWFLAEKIRRGTITVWRAQCLEIAYLAPLFMGAPVWFLALDPVGGLWWRTGTQSAGGMVLLLAAGFCWWRETSLNRDEPKS